MYTKTQCLASNVHALAHWSLLELELFVAFTTQTIGSSLC